MKVRAKQNGVYGGYVRYGPTETADGTMLEGEVFEIDATPFEVRDPETNKPVQEMRQGDVNPATGIPQLVPVWALDHNGKPKRDKEGSLIPKIKMATMYSPEWMEPVNDDASVTYPEHSKPFGVLAQMMPKATPANRIAARPATLPADIEAVLAGKESPI